MRRLLIKSGLTIVVVFAAVSQVYTYETGAPPAKTGAPSETTCRSCHSDNILNSPGGSIQVNIYDHSGREVHSFIKKDTVYGLITFMSPHRGTKGGFELTVLDDSTKKFGGSFIIGKQQQKIRDTVNGNVRYYLTHTIGKIDSAGICKWKFRWIAPDSIEKIKFYVSTNAGNFDQDVTGDYIYNDSFMFFEKSYLGLLHEWHNSHLNIFPNPANNYLQVNYMLAEASGVEISLFNLSGELIRQKNPINQSAGESLITFNDLEGLESGVYFLRLSTGKLSLVKKIILLH